MTRHEKQVLIDLLLEVAKILDEHSNHTCETLVASDWSLLNTPENQALYTKYRDWSEEKEPFSFSSNPFPYNHITFDKIELVEYFAYILRQEQKRKICNFIL